MRVNELAWKLPCHDELIAKLGGEVLHRETWAVFKLLLGSRK